MTVPMVPATVSFDDAYDIVRPTKSGAFTLTGPWLEQNLGLRPSDRILEIHLPGGGALLMRFNPALSLEEQLRQAMASGERLLESLERDRHGQIQPSLNTTGPEPSGS